MKFYMALTYSYYNYWSWSVHDSEVYSASVWSSCSCLNVKRKVLKANSEHVPPTNYYQRQPTVNVNLIAHRQGKNNISAEPTSKYVIFTFPFRGQRSYQKTCSFIKVRVPVNTIKALTSQFYYKMFHQSFSLLGVVYYIIV